MDTFSFKDIATEMASGWGKTAETIQDAIKSLPATDASGAALLYLVAAIERLRPKSHHNEATKPIRYAGGAGKFPGIKIGDFLYYADTDDETIVYRRIVVGLCENDECLVVRADADPDTTYHPSVPNYADDDDFRTPEEALRSGAESELEYHEPKANAAKEILSMIDSNKDLSKYFAWIPSGEQE